MKNAQKAIDAIDAIRASASPVLTPEDVGPALGLDPNSIRHQAKENPLMLGFPVCRTGSTTTIPRRPFLRWLTGE